VARAVCAGPRVAYDYPLVLKGPPAVRGARVRGFAAYSCRAGVWRQVPTQVEEVNAQGDYVLADGLPYTKNTDDGWFDANDELVLDGADLGDDFTAVDVPATLAGESGSWKVAFCRAGHLAGHLLITTGSTPRPWLGKSAVRFDQAQAEIRTALYDYAFRKDHPALLGEVALRHGKQSVPILSASKFLMPLRTPFFFPDLTFRADDFTSRIESWQSGPLRTIVAVGVEYRAFLSLYKLHLFSELVFYRNRFAVPTVIEFVFDPSRYLEAGSGLAYSLKFASGQAFRVTSNLPALPALPPDTAVQAALTRTAPSDFRVSGRGASGAFLVDVHVGERARRLAPPPFLIDQQAFTAKAYQDAWPWLKELRGDLGLYLDFSRIPAGVYDFGLDLLLSPKADETFTDYGSVNTDWQALPIHN